MTKEAPAKENGKQQNKEQQVTFNVMVKDGKTVLVSTDDAAGILKVNPPATGKANEEGGQVVKQTNSKGKSTSKKTKKSTPDRANKESKRKDSKGQQCERCSSKTSNKKKSKSKQSLKTQSKSKTNQPSLIVINIEKMTVLAPTEGQEGSKQAPAVKENPNAQGSPADPPAGLKVDKENAKADGNKP